MTATPHYKKPGWFTQHVLNRSVNGLMRLGISLRGSRILEVKGRSSGITRRTPVNLLALRDGVYLVSPRGEGQWVRNVRAAGALDLLVGRRREHYAAVEVPVDARVPLLRAYLVRWKAEVGVFFEGVGPTSSDEELQAIAARHPVFELHRS